MSAYLNLLRQKNFEHSNFAQVIYFFPRIKQQNITCIEFVMQSCLKPSPNE